MRIYKDGRHTGLGHGAGKCKCHPNSRFSYREEFLALNGSGPYPCGEKKLGCGELVMSVNADIDHVDGDDQNNDPANWQAMHHECHARKSAIEDGRGERVTQMNDHPNNSQEARAERARQQWAQRKTTGERTIGR